MKFIQVGGILNTNQIKSISFLSDQYFIDNDVLFISLHAVQAEIIGKFGKGSILIQTYNSIIESLQIKRKQIAEFYSLMGTVVLIIDVYPVMSFTVNIQPVKRDLDLIKIFTVTDFEIGYESLQGDTVEYDKTVKIVNENFNSRFFTLFDSKDYKRLIWTSKAKRDVAFSKVMNEGLLICLPQLTFKHIGLTPDKKQQHLLLDTETIINNLKPETIIDQQVVPEWLNEINIGEESQVLIEIEKLTKQLNIISNSIESENIKLSKYQKIKSLLYLDGKSLENIVKFCFELLGFPVNKLDGKEADLVILDTDFKAIIEVKGVGGGGALKHSRQLEHWVSDYGNDNNEDIKGILILNAYKNTSLKERSEISFPEDMVRFSTKKDHCLMLTEDLLNIYIDYTGNSITQAEIKVLLQNTCGILKYELKQKSDRDLRPIA